MLIKEKKVKGWFTKWCWGEQDEVGLAKPACFSGQGHVWLPELVPGPSRRLPPRLCIFSCIKSQHLRDDTNAKLEALKISIT